MSGLISRTYRGPEDLQAMTHLLQLLRQRGQKVYPVATDLFEELADAQVQAGARLWVDASGELAGFAYVSQWQNLVDAFSADEFTPAIEQELMDWAVNVMAERNRVKGEHLTLDASTLEDDPARVALLERHGFIRQAETSLLLARSLELPFPDPQLPPGFTIRPMAGEPELEAYVALHRAAFGTENMTLDYRRSIMSAPGYQPELDLVAVAPDGSLTAFCVCQIFADDQPRAGGKLEGWTDPLGTHPRWQRHGLALALILEGLRLLKAKGMDTALMGTSSTNLAMQRTAEKAGFHVASNTLWYSKSVE